MENKKPFKWKETNKKMFSELPLDVIGFVINPYGMIPDTTWYCPIKLWITVQPHIIGKAANDEHSPSS